MINDNDPDNDNTIRTEQFPDIPTSWERYTVLIVFSIAALYMMKIGNTAGALLALGNIATYFLSRTGA